jgi:hypothetical protein
MAFVKVIRSYNIRGLVRVSIEVVHIADAKSSLSTKFFG